MSRKRQGTNQTIFGSHSGINIGLLVLIFSLAFGLYVNTLQHGFVYDDVTLIEQNQQVKSSQWTEIMSPKGYRPIRTLTYAMNFVLGGTDPYGYHLFNVLLHASNAVLVLFLFWCWSHAKILAVAGALFFAVHPVQTAAVAYVSGRKDLLATFFVLLGCLCYRFYRERKKRYLPVLVAFCFILAILSKEVAIVFPALLLLMDAFLWKEPRKDPPSFFSRLLQAFKGCPVLYGAFLILACLGIYYTIFLSTASRMTGFWGGGLATNLGTSVKLFAHYLKLVFFPYPLIADYSGSVFPISKGFAESMTLLAVLMLAAYVVFAILGARRSPSVSFAMFWFLIALLPVLQLVPFHELAADHFLYLPMLGMAWLAGWAVDYLVREKGLKMGAWAVVAVTVTPLAVMTVRRNQDWKNEQTLWEATLEKAPGSYRANTNLGVIYQGQGRWKEALKRTKRSLELDPSKALSWSNLGGIYQSLARNIRLKGKLQEAATLAEEAIRNLRESTVLDPKNPFAFNNLGNAYKELALIWELKGDPEKAAEMRISALESFGKGLRIPSQNENFPFILYNMSLVFIDGGYYEWALKYLKKAATALPHYALGQYWIGWCYFQQQDYRKSIPNLDKFSRLQPTQKVEVALVKRGWNMLARSYEEVGNNDQAIQTYQRTLVQFPHLVEAHYNLGILYHRVGEPDEAAQYLRHALRLAPEGPLAANIEAMLDLISRSRSVGLLLQDVSKP